MKAEFLTRYRYCLITACLLLGIAPRLHAQSADAFATAAKHTAFSAEVREAMSALEGLAVLESMKTDTSGGKFTVTGTINFSRARTSKAGAVSDALNVAMSAAGNVLTTLGSSPSVPVTISITPGTAVTLSLAFTLVRQGGEINISPAVMGAKVDPESLTVTLAATQPVSKPLPPAVYSLSGSGRMFLKPSVADPWLDFKAGLSANTAGQLTLSGDVLGACPKPASPCNQEWNLLGLGLARTNAARMDVTFQGNSVLRIQAAITDGKLGTSKDLLVNGVVVADARGASYNGIALTTTGTPTVQGVMAAMSPFGYAFAKVAGIAGKLPNPQIPLNGQATIIAVPFSLTGGGYNITSPTLGFSLSASSGGVAISANAEAKSNIMDILGMKPGAAPTGSASFQATFDNEKMKTDVRAATQRLFGANAGRATEEAIDFAMQYFTFEKTSVAIDMARPQDAKAELRFSVLGQSVALSVDAESAAAPVAAIASRVKGEADMKLRICNRSNTGYACYDNNAKGVCAIGSDTIPRCVQMAGNCDAACQEAISRKCTISNQGYACYQGHTRGVCGVTLGSGDCKIGASQGSSCDADCQARERRCTRDNQGYACYQGNRKGTCGMTAGSGDCKPN